MFDYKSDWENLVYTESEGFATAKALEEAFSCIDFGDETLTAGGVPLLVEGNRAIVNNETEHMLIVGESGSKKTRCVVKPLCVTLAKAKESMIVIDVKGEISTDPKIRGILEANDINCVYLDLRNFDADGFNIFEHAIDMYTKGQEDKALSSVASVISALISKYDGTKADPFWNDMSTQHLMSIAHILLEIAKNDSKYRDCVNIFSVSSFADSKGTQTLERILESYYDNVHNNSIQMLKSVVDSPERTKASILAVTASLIKDFIIQRKLMAMLSETTFDIQSLYEKPTCIFVIVPDETSAYDAIAGLILDSFYNQLIGAYTEKYQNSCEPPCRVNWVCDEFANIRINEMRAKISASRSRCMRWFLVCQSLKQLEAEYSGEAATIIGNCKNVLFLQSSDPEMLDYISSISGTTYVTEKSSEALLPVEQLKRLKKTREFKDAIFIRDSLVFKAQLPDIDRYAFLDRFKGPVMPIPKKERGKVRSYTPKEMLTDIRAKRIEPPFYI